MEYLDSELYLMFMNMKKDDIMASTFFSEKVTFPFRALKSDTIVFLVTILH